MAQQQRTSRRDRLNRDLVLRTAVALADEAGIEGLTMRTLSREFGVVPMALYKHVANKEDLLDGMIDVVFDEVDVPDSGAHWKTALRERAIALRRALTRHAWAIGQMNSRMHPGPANLRHHNAVMGCLRQAGFSSRTTVHAYSALDSYTYGFALQEGTLRFETPDQSGDATKRAAQLASLADDYPYLVGVVIDHRKTGYDSLKEFKVGLDLLLDGIEKLRPHWNPASN
jgi:AcrR family transcriptional regulator